MSCASGTIVGTQLRVSGALLSSNLPPTVSLDSPAPGNYLTPIAFNLAATASDPDGAIDHVDFLSNGTTLATKLTPPYTFTWTSVLPGSYQLTAAAVDGRGARTTSSVVSVVVSSPALLPAPTNLVATVLAGTVNLTWSPPAGGPPVATYRIYRSTTSGFTPGPANLIGQASVRRSPMERCRAAATTTRSSRSTAAGTPARRPIKRRRRSREAFRSTTWSSPTAAARERRRRSARRRPGELLLVFAASDGPQAGGQTLTITGAGLTWTLVARMNTQPGSSEIWKAVAPGVLANATVTSTPSRTGFNQSLTVIAFAGAGGTGAAFAASGIGAPSVSLTTTRAGSLVYGVGNDWDGAVARTVGASQEIVHQWLDTGVGDTFWVQKRSAPIAAAGTVVQLNDTAPTSHRWNLAAVEILAPAAAGNVPNVVGQARGAAQSQITGAGLAVGSVTTQPSATAPVNTVISQSPTGGSQVAAGSAVNLVVSSGSADDQRPERRRADAATAQSQITSAGLAVGSVTTQPSATAPLNTVISQSPTGGSQVAAGSAVNLVVSAGPQTTNVPNVVAQTLATAQSQITAPASPSARWRPSRARPLRSTP